MPIPEELGFNSQQIIDEVAEKITDFETVHQDKINRLQSAWNTYKGIPEERHKRVSDGLANTFVYESSRIVDTLASTKYRMMMGQGQPFDIRSLRLDIPEEVLYRLETLYRKQLEWSQYPRNLYRGVKSCEMIGTLVVEEPWMQGPLSNGMPIWETTGFIPRPLNQIFFAPNAIEIELADYIGTMDIVTKYKLNILMNQDVNQEAWLHRGLTNAINEDVDMIPSAVSRRLMSSGYHDLEGMKELSVYRGPLESQNSYQDWMVGLVNRRHLVRFHAPALPERGFRTAYSSYIEQEAFGMGVQHYDLLQKMLNANRNRLFDLITFSLYSMFKVDRYAGLDVREAKIKPWSFLFMDNIGGMEPLRPDLNAAIYGIRLDEIMKEEMRSRTGATANLQAITTDVTATEVNLVMDQATRKIGVETEIMAESLMRQHFYYMDKMNKLFLDRPIWLATTGSHGPLMVSPEDVAHEIDFEIKIATDKDFRPNMLRRMVEFIQIATSVRNDLPEPLNLKPWFQKIAKLSDIDPKTIFLPPQQPPNFMDMAMENFQKQQARMGLINKEAGLFGTPAPLEGEPINSLQG